MRADDARLFDVLQTRWGYTSFRPLQHEAIAAILGKQDSVVVLPTGGGKSLCYQLPAVLMPGLAVVVSPLISLMKDQVDALTEIGIPAAAVHSALLPSEKQRIAEDIRAARLKLLYVAPERLVTERMLTFLRQQTVSFIAIDEAHCISAWGHDFRPEYRRMGELREQFPGVGVHAFTATATERVRQDIAGQLHLQSAEFHVGSFDRPNLHYRVERRSDKDQQIRDVLQRHAGDAGIIYCISRKEVDALAEALQSAGVKAVPYHAGLPDEVRHRNQDAFLNEQADVVVATVAFGMGIDKSNVRFVVHTGAPKSLEHYQQETGRAGRDGLDSECCLLYGGNDFQIWRKMMQELTGDAAAHADHNLQLMERYCIATGCRHRALVEHFGQSYPGESCAACDVCLNEQEYVPDALIVAQKILSCVVRVRESFGAEYVALVLSGSRDQRILDNGHDQLSTYGLLKEHGKSAIREWIEQLCAQDHLAREGEYRILKIAPAGRDVLRGATTPRLLKPAAKKQSRPAPAKKNFTLGMDAGLFEVLRKLRRELAEERGVPPFVVFGDVTLQDLASRRPTSPAGFRETHGVGDQKARQYAEAFTQAIARYCASNGIPADVAVADDAPPTAGLESFSTTSKSAARQAAAALFREGRSLEDVMQQIGRARSTVTQYLVEFLSEEGHLSPEPWLSEERFVAVAAAVEVLGPGPLKPIFDRLGGAVSYDDIRVAVACLRNRSESGVGASGG
ncbi:MAG: DNA helicase RecQ [Planctomycetaceae bacterium]|nr:DNA helicase RecQ [Planctomycetaceae bacterium]